jgi:hypothetical protein
MTTERYFMMCEQLGQEPKQEEIPASFEDFPHIVQTAMNIHATLPDNWEGFSGTYMGKDYMLLPYLADKVYNVENKAQLVRFVTLIDSIIMKQRAADQKRKQRKNKNRKKVP